MRASAFRVPLSVITLPAEIITGPNPSAPTDPLSITSVEDDGRTLDGIFNYTLSEQSDENPDD